MTPASGAQSIRKLAVWTACALMALGALPFCSRSKGPEDAVFVYDLFAGTPSCPDLQKRLQALSLRPTVILSIEQGPEFLLASREGEARVTCAVGWLREHNYTFKPMLLQDPSFIEHQNEATRRMRLVAEYAKRQPVAGAVIDIEPYGDPSWTCAASEQRRALISRYRDLLRALHSAAGALPLETAAPWWLTTMNDVPDMQPQSMLQDVSGMYLMVYADEGGPLIGGTADRIAQHVPPDSAYFGQANQQGKIYLGIATYETSSRETLEQEIKALQRRYANVPGFGGTAVFHAASRYNVPLVRSLDGKVVDDAGKDVAGAKVEFAGMSTYTSGCGNFGFRAFGAIPGGELIVSNPGYEPQSRQVQIAPPGQGTEVGTITLKRRK